MQHKIFAAITFALAGISRAQDIDNNDVPNQCRSLCDPVVQLTQQCDTQNDDDDSGYINCVCNGQNASSIVPACEACVAVYDERDNDVYDIVTSCGFSSATFTSGSTVPTSSTPVTNSAGSTTTTPSSTRSVGTTVSTTITSNSMLSALLDSQVTTTVATEVAATTTSQTSSGDNAAPMMTMAPLAGAGALVLAVGLL